MTDAREIIARHLCTMAAQGWSGISAFERAAYRTTAAGMVEAVTSAGYRIIGKDEVDQMTVDKCASIADADGRRELSWAEMSLPVSPGPVIAKDRAAVSDRIASAIRAIGRKA